MFWDPIIEKAQSSSPSRSLCSSSRRPADFLSFKQVLGLLAEQSFGDHPRGACRALFVPPLQAHRPLAKQVIRRGSQFLDTCRADNDGTAPRDELLATTVRSGFNNVIDAFHIVGDSELPIQFYTKDYSAPARKIILTDEIFKLQGAAFSSNLTPEADARRRLVETAWEQRISTGLLAVEYSEIGDLLFTRSKNRRKAVTSARAALNGYQNSRTFGWALHLFP